MKELVLFKILKKKPFLHISIVSQIWGLVKISVCMLVELYKLVRKKLNKPTSILNPILIKHYLIYLLGICIKVPNMTLEFDVMFQKTKN